MSGKFTPSGLPQLVKAVMDGLSRDRFYNIPRSLFFTPGGEEKFGIYRYNRLLSTPVGVAAGPHTQLARNIVAAWFCGARYIELKTVQTLDELEVAKPCIDMQDEGYNCEWSQELKLEESFREYLHAWVAIHILHRELGFSGDIGTIFNMSLGYNLDGILKSNVQQFLAGMQDCSDELNRAVNSIRSIYPAIDELQIPALISDNVTLSTMHGCPPEEIERIGRYLLQEKNLHTTIKLNPTLLGSERLRFLLNKKLGFPTVVPDLAFEHDLKYPDAIKMLQALDEVARERGLSFGVKLTNTLECVNTRDFFPESEKMMYMSGRALHPISIELARKLQDDFNGDLDISFSAGVDCFNFPEVLACGIKPVTVCSDLLKPGGYGRLSQYLNRLNEQMLKAGAAGLDDFVYKTAGQPGLSLREAALKNLSDYAGIVIDDTQYKKQPFREDDIKTSRLLEWFDCIHAPCVDTCPTGQDIPGYMRHVAAGNSAAAFETILQTNPFPTVTGMVCDHLCQLKCTRMNYDNALHIREIKAFVAEFGATPPPAPPLEGEGRGRMAVIGAGPAGLSCAWFLRKAGCEVDIYEEKPMPGGMVSAAIPAFRLTDEAVDADIQRILASGVKLHDNSPVDRKKFEELAADYDRVFLAAGAQRSARIDLEGAGLNGVLDPLKFLFDVRSGNHRFDGCHVVIIGGGNTAMDAARTALRLVGESGSVKIVYRRTLREMPADQGEIKAALAEGGELMELIRPVTIRESGGKVSALLCRRTVLSVTGKDGRPVPVDVPGSEFEISCDTVIPAIGQELAIDFLTKEELRVVFGSYGTSNPKLFIGGDALRGASTAINAIADGRKAAMEMLSADHQQNSRSAGRVHSEPIQDGLHVKKASRIYSEGKTEDAVIDPLNFNLLYRSLSEGEAMREAARCLECDRICNVCVSVCPNLANFGYEVVPAKYQMQKAVKKDDGQITFEPGDIFTIDQAHQVLNIRDFCNDCGNCTTFCPSSGRPFKDKPGLHLNISSLNEEGNGFFLSRLPDRDILIYKEQNHIRTLFRSDDLYYYETDQVKAVLNPDFTLHEVHFLTPCVKEFHFNFAAEMSIVLQGALKLAD